MLWPKLTSCEFSSAVYSRFIQRFEPKKIIVPFPKELVQLLGYDALRVRGDIGKLLVFVKLYGLFNLKRLDQIKDVYVLSPEVAVHFSLSNYRDQSVSTELLMDPELTVILSEIIIESANLRGADSAVALVNIWNRLTPV